MTGQKPSEAEKPEIKREKLDLKQCSNESV